MTDKPMTDSEIASLVVRLRAIEPGAHITVKRHAAVGGGTVTTKGTLVEVYQHGHRTSGGGWGLYGRAERGDVPAWKLVIRPYRKRSKRAMLVDGSFVSVTEGW